MVIQGVTYLSDFEAKKAIIEMARRLEAKGWLVAGDGSMSVRVGPQAVWVTVAGAPTRPRSRRICWCAWI